MTLMTIAMLICYHSVNVPTRQN